ncbi:MAG: gliding motility lipoprotein GldD [Bacteroidetes bacterium]|nr:MAG: gliding motility lipoprotein GldD [Bacteroidota bacterium]
MRKTNFVTLLVFLSASFSCREVSVPKPKGHFRIDLPQKQYLIFDQTPDTKGYMPISFEYPAYGNLTFQDGQGHEQGWFNVEFPHYKAKIYLTYKNIKNDFEGLMEQTYKMNVKNHIAKAEAINEQVFNNMEENVYGILYDLKGNTASAVQFYVTDSTHHYLRGSLYFSVEPNADSLAPVISFFRDDMVHLIETLKWKK